jgi:hypothetical protein
LDINTSQIYDIGQHQTAINYIKSLPDYPNTLLTSAYEKNVHIWSLNQNGAVQSSTFSKKIYKASYGGGVIATALAD